ncbi:unnamed protein product [Phyllotreta striolata]|uniref:TBC1 domain family member 31 n=1 Tax=Phyllotreta striolata TaxID=444603 RepID=A0A9N9XS61_PHYSR|nr:unnamed protein product [Phyllotreta striolata]
MDLRLETTSEENKKLFKLKPQRKDGLLLSVHHTIGNTKTRFVYGCFHHFNNIVAVANNQGNVFIIDYSVCRFWGLRKFDSCTFISFSPQNSKHLLVGVETGVINLCDMITGSVEQTLKGHKFGVVGVSFDKSRYCLSYSKYEAIIWDMESATKVQVLRLEPNCSLKYVSFVPFSEHIVTCFQDDLIQIWSHHKFKIIKQLSPANWKNYFVKSITFTRNGEYMVVSGHVSTIGIFHLDTYKVLKIINLSDYLKSIKQVEFVPQPFDGGCNKILAILSGQGIVFFFDVERNEIISELRCQVEINKISCSTDSAHIICLLCSGTVDIYNSRQYTSPPREIHVHKIRKKLTTNRKSCAIEAMHVKKEISELLDMKKLRYILKEHLEYPSEFRMKIWEHLLQLPNNVEQYNSIINKTTLVAFDDLHERYPLEDRTFINALKMLLNNLVTWSPFFSHVEYLPVFTFPFVRVFHNKPVACFEAACTVIMNWCQHWFEYFPLAPVNILAIAENMLMEHEPELLDHFTSHKITANVFVWCLLETAFSEVLTSSDWLTLWDHVLTNEISFLISTVVAYNSLQKHSVMALASLEDVQVFYKNQNPIDVRKLIRMSYSVLKSTSARFHPRQYLSKFQPLDRHNYPLFFEYPKKIFDIKEERASKLDMEMIKLLIREHDLRKTRQRSRKASLEVDEEKRRLREVEKLCSNQIKTRVDLIADKQKRLRELEDDANKQIVEDDEFISHVLKATNGNETRREQMAVNADLVDKFIRTLSAELGQSSEINRFPRTDTKSLLNRFIENLNEDLKSTHNRVSKSTRSSCKSHSSDQCSCDTLCTKTVRFTSSTTGGSTDW